MECLLWVHSLVYITNLLSHNTVCDIVLSQTMLYGGSVIHWLIMWYLHFHHQEYKCRGLKSIMKIYWKEKNRYISQFSNHHTYTKHITKEYSQVSNIRHTLVGNKIVDHSYVVGASPVYIFILDLTPGFIGLGKDNCKTRRETIKFGYLVCLILEILQYLTHWPLGDVAVI